MRIVRRPFARSHTHECFGVTIDGKLLWSTAGKPLDHQAIRYLGPAGRTIDRPIQRNGADAWIG